MDQIFQAYSALNAELQEDVKLIVLVFLQIETKTTKDFEFLNNLLIKLKTTSNSENHWIQKAIVTSIVCQINSKINSIKVANLIPGGKDLLLADLMKEEDEYYFYCSISKACVYMGFQSIDNMNINDVLLMFKCKLVVSE